MLYEVNVMVRIWFLQHTAHSKQAKIRGNEADKLVGKFGENLHQPSKPLSIIMFRF